MQAGNFVITEQDQVTTIGCKRSRKEWMAIISPLALGAGVAFFTIMMYFQTYYHQLIFWVLASLFLLLAVVKLTDGFSRLLQPTGDRTVIDQQLRTLSAWLPDGEKLVFSFDDIRAVLLKDMPNNVKVLKQPQSPRTLAICIETRDGAEQVIALLHPAQDPSNVPVDTDSMAQALTRIIADKTGSLFEDNTVNSPVDALHELHANI